MSFLYFFLRSDAAEAPRRRSALPQGLGGQAPGVLSAWKVEASRPESPKAPMGYSATCVTGACACGVRVGPQIRCLFLL